MQTTATSQNNSGHRKWLWNGDTHGMVVHSIPYQVKTSQNHTGKNTHNTMVISVSCNLCGMVPRGHGMTSHLSTFSTCDVIVGFGAPHPNACHTSLGIGVLCDPIVARRVARKFKSCNLLRGPLRASTVLPRYVQQLANLPRYRSFYTFIHL